MPGTGVNVNELTSNRPEDLEVLAGMSVLNAVAVRLEAVAASPTHTTSAVLPETH
ncbi:MAG: hypothetical protein WBO08_01945 [Mycobacterium sp.]